MVKEKVLVVDFGGQYCHLIARRCREEGVYSEIVLHKDLKKEADSADIKGIILSGGPMSVYEDGSPKIDDDLFFKIKIPILGICYGHQLIAYVAGAKVTSGRPEYGRTEVKIVKDSKIFKGLPKEMKVWMSHSDQVKSLPEWVEVIALTKSNTIAGIKYKDLPVYGLQFHPEVTHTTYGKEILRNFLFDVCKFSGDWKPEDIVSKAVEEVKKTVKDDVVICAVSGGIDSTTTCIIVHRAIGKNLSCLFVNHGLMRKDEPDQVIRFLRGLGINVKYVDASERFLSKLKGIKDPEAKRKVIGEEFIRVFEEFASKVPNAKWLAQGTIYPDRIESGMVGAGSWRIKSHHNVAALPSGMKLKIIEPLRDLYKDEVRKVAMSLGIPEDIVNRHPFPGPGLAVRIVGEVTDEKLRICREANAIVEEELRNDGIYDEVWQAFAVVGEDRWTGVKGDRRDLGYTVTIRIVTSYDGMTADWARISWDVIDRISRRITNELPQVTMVTYAVSSKPPSTIEPC